MSAPAASPSLTLRTLTRGDGLLGLRAAPGLGPRGAQLTVALVQDADEPALTELRARGLQPVPPKAMQWRDARLADELNLEGQVWTLAEEAHFADFWAEQVPRLQARGWRIAVMPGFAHFSVPVQRWRFGIGPAAELAEPPGPREPVLSALHQPKREGSWLLSLGVEVEGELLDLTPMLARLFKTDRRWLDPVEVAEIDEEAIVVLRGPAGKRIETVAGPIKAIVVSMLEVLIRIKPREGPLKLSSWEAQQAEALRVSLMESQRERAGPQGAWALQGDEGLTRLAARLRGAGGPPAVAPPPGLMATLRPYQGEGLAWLQYLREQQLGGILADDMGLGKTVQVLAHLLTEKHASRLDRPALAVLPTSLVANWQAEAARHAPSLRVLALQGPRRKRDFPRIAEHDLVLTTYPLLSRDLDALKPQPWHLLVMDEAQFAKNAGTRAASAARRLDVRHRLCVTGTPLENHLGELWAHFDWLMPGFLGDARTFTRVWRKPIEENGEQRRAEQLAMRVRPFILRRRKDEVATELPPRSEVIRRVVLQGQQRTLYESVRLAADEWVRRVLKSTPLRSRQMATLDALLKLRQVCCDPRLVKGEGTPPTMERAKLDVLFEMLPVLRAEGHHVLVFSQFTELLGLVHEGLQASATSHLMLTGRTPPGERARVVQRFQAGEVPLMLASLKAGGVGLNLTAADTVIHLDPWWNPAVQEQATARAHRIGQHKPVFVYKLVVQGSIEERMLALQARKAALAASVLGQDAAGALKFSAAELAELLAPLDA